MSRRYGRNQKRKAREQIAALERERARNADWIKRQNETLSDQAYSLDIARRVLGRNHLAFPAEKCEQFNGRFIDWRDYGDLLPVRGLPPGNIPERVTEYRSRLDIMTARAERSERGDMVHLKVAYDGEVWGYAICRKAFNSMPPDALAKTIARELAPLIVRTLVEEARRGRNLR